MTDEKIARINELAHKKKTEGLTEAETAEQAILRKEFLEEFRGNLKTQLDSIDVVEKDGKVVNLGERYGRKQK